MSGGVLVYRTLGIVESNMLYQRALLVNYTSYALAPPITIYVCPKRTLPMRVKLLQIRKWGTADLAIKARCFDYNDLALGLISVVGVDIGNTVLRHWIIRVYVGPPVGCRRGVFQEVINSVAPALGNRRGWSLDYP